MSGTTNSTTTPTSRRLAGITSCTVDGVAYNVIDYSWAPGTRERETLRSLSGIDGYLERPAPGHIQLKFRDAQNVNVSSFSSKSSSTVVLQLANGKSVQGHNVWNVPLPEVNATEAAFDVRFEGDDITETGVLAS